MTLQQCLVVVVAEFMYETSQVLMRTLLVTSTAHETTSIRCWVVANFGT